MVAELKKGGDGHLLKNTAGNLINDCGNPCDPDAEMLCTVTGATGTINWVGETWVLPGDSGLQKSVCPTLYNAPFRQTLTTPYQAYDAGHLWQHNSDLVLHRTYRATLYGGVFYRTQGLNHNILGFQGTPTSIFRFSGQGAVRPVAPTATFTTQVGAMNMISGVADPTWSDYQITDAFFGSYTTGGITYAWEKGAGWP